MTESWMDNEWSEESLCDVERVLYVIKRHKAIMARRKMGVDKGSYIHHIDGNPHNNEASNLRVVKMGE